MLNAGWDDREYARLMRQIEEAMNVDNGARSLKGAAVARETIRGARVSDDFWG